MKDLVPSTPQRTDAYSRIKAFTSNEESGIVLFPKEEKMLVRWCHVQGLLAERKFDDDEIIDQMVDRFDISASTARNDINYARSLFVEQLKNAKKFSLYHHARALEKLFQEKVNDKAFAPYLAKLADSVTRAWNAVPEEMEVPDVAAPILILQSVTNNITVVADDARKAADELIEQERNHEEIDFEDLPNGS